MRGLPPAANASQQLQERLAEDIPVDRILSGLKEMLGATFVNKAGVELPDYKAREAGLKLYLSYAEGLPIHRKVVTSPPPVRSEEDVWDEIKNSPAAMEVMRGHLARVEAELIAENRPWSLQGAK